MAITKKWLCKKYDAEIFQTIQQDSGKKFWVALPNDRERALFNYADGWDLKELEANIKKDVKEWAKTIKDWGVE